MPNPNMTYKELREQIYKIIMEAMHTATAPQFGSSYQPYSTDELTDQVTQLFATLCTEVIGEDGEVTGYTRRNGELSVDLTESYHNELRKQQRTRLAQLTTKNTEEENV